MRKNRVNNLGIYIHIPFCERKCAYCDFPSYEGLSHLYADYTEALCKEIAAKSRLYLDVPVDTVYVGGGTPSLLPRRLLEKIFCFLRKYFKIASNAEITLEANPGTINKEFLKCLCGIGINRLSIGAQSFEDELLLAIGRTHTASGALRAVEKAKESAFTNISLDLMYGLPGQSLAQFQKSLETAVKLKVGHLSVYGLKIEEGAPFFGLYGAGKLRLPDEQTEEMMYGFMIDYLNASGYFRYEISNFALPDAVCRHNLKYWRYEPYLGFGAAAHSFARGAREGNTVNVRKYIEKIGAGLSPVETFEEIGCEDAMGEFIFLALRTSAGLYYQDFENYFKVNFREKYAAVIEKLLNLGLLARDDWRLYLTKRGMKFANQVFVEFLPD